MLFMLRKRYLSTGLLLLLLASLVLPAEATEIRVIDLATYLDLVQAQNLDLKVAEIQLVQSELAYKRAEAANWGTGSRQAARKAESDWAQAQASFAETRSGIMQEAVSRYFAVILAEMDLQIRERRLELAQARREITERKVGQGISSEMDLLQATRDVERAKLDLERARQTYEERVLSFNSYAGAEQTTYLPGDPPIYPIVKYDPEVAVQKALESSSRLRRLRELADLARLELLKTEAEGAAELVLAAARNDLVLAELEVRRAEAQLQANVRSDLFTLKSLEKQIALSQLDLEIQLATYETVEKQYEAGLLTGRDLDEAAANLWQSQQAVLEAKRSYALQLLAFKELLGEELE